MSQLMDTDQHVASPSTGDEKSIKERGNTCKPVFLGSQAKPGACSSWIVARAPVSTWRAPQLKVWPVLPVWPGSWRARLGDCLLAGRGGCEPTSQCYPVHVRPGATPQACRGHRTGLAGLGDQPASRCSIGNCTCHRLAAPLAVACCVIGELHHSASESSGQCLTSLAGLAHKPDTQLEDMPCSARTVELGDGRCVHVQPVLEVAGSSVQP